MMAIDLGRVFLGWVSLNNSVRIAASYAAVHPNAWNPLNPDADAQAEYQALIASDAAQINCHLPTPVPDPSFPAGTDVADPALVSITCPFDLITPLMSALLPNPLPVTSTAAFPIRTGTIEGIPAGTAVPYPTETPEPTAPPTAEPTAPPTGPPTAPPTDPPTAPPTASPTPTPTPMCRVPPLNQSDDAQARWTAAGFQTAVIFNPIVPPHYLIRVQSLAQNTDQPCAGTSITVGP
jgi:hypothetical protein